MDIGETAKTVALHPLDCRMYASEKIWHDAIWALEWSARGWVYVEDDDKATRSRLAARFGGLPQHPGEYMEMNS